LSTNQFRPVEQKSSKTAKALLFSLGTLLTALPPPFFRASVTNLLLSSCVPLLLGWGKRVTAIPVSNSKWQTRGICSSLLYPGFLLRSHVRKSLPNFIPQLLQPPNYSTAGTNAPVRLNSVRLQKAADCGMGELHWIPAWLIILVTKTSVRTCCTVTATPLYSTLEMVFQNWLYLQDSKGSLAHQPAVRNQKSTGFPHNTRHAL